MFSRSDIIIPIVMIGVVALAVGGVFYYQHNKVLTDSAAATSLLASSESVAPYTDLDGNAIDLRDYFGSIMIVNAWATWCPFCKSELADFEKLASTYADQEVIVLAINRSESKEVAKRFIEKHGPFNHVTFILDQDDRFYDSVGGFSMPETIFYNPDGEVVLQKRGVMKFEEMKQQLQAMIQNEDD